MGTSYTYFPCVDPVLSVLTFSLYTFVSPTVSFNQAIGSTTPFFTAIFAFFCQGTRENYLTYLTLVPM